MRRAKFILISTVLGASVACIMNPEDEKKNPSKDPAVCESGVAACVVSPVEYKRQGGVYIDYEFRVSGRMIRNSSQITEIVREVRLSTQNKLCAVCAETRPQCGIIRVEEPRGGSVYVSFEVRGGGKRFSVHSQMEEAANTIPYFREVGLCR